MYRHTYYDSPFGKMYLLACDQSLVGLWFIGQKYERRRYENIISHQADDDPLLQLGTSWLNAYFEGQPVFPCRLPLAPQGTLFYQEVWHLLTKIPYGKTTTYGEIADKIAQKHHRHSMSSQAIGQAVSHNPISIMIPCHRVIAKSGKLTGYAAGLEIKKALLSLEGAYYEKTGH